MFSSRLSVNYFSVNFNGCILSTVCWWLVKKCLTSKLCRLAISWEQGKDKHTTGNMVAQPSDRFVCGACVSQQLVLKGTQRHIWATRQTPPTQSHAVFGCAFPIDYLAGRDETGGEGWESGCGGGFSTLAGCGQLDQRFEFLLAARLKFQPLKIGGNKRLGSQNNLAVWFFPPFSCFSCPGSFARPQHSFKSRWYDSKYDYVKIFDSKHGWIVQKDPSTVVVLCWISSPHSCSGHSVVHVVGIVPSPQRVLSSWSEVSHPAMYLLGNVFRKRELLMWQWRSRADARGVSNNRMEQGFGVASPKPGEVGEPWLTVTGEVEAARRCIVRMNHDDSKDSVRDGKHAHKKNHASRIHRHTPLICVFRILTSIRALYPHILCRDWKIR